MFLNESDIIEWILNYNTTGVPLEKGQIAEFVKKLHEKINQMNFAVSTDTVIVGYSGESNGKEAWKIASSVSDKANEGATYISDLPAGKLIGVYRKDLSKALENVVGDNSNYIENIISGGYKDEFGNWIRLEGGSCGFGEGILSLDDFVSSKLMGETVGASNNLIVFIPEGVEHTKVFATTELECIFKNDTFQYINGIPKSELESIYRSGDVGKQSCNIVRMCNKSNHVIL